ncbi:MAG: hypothetical protein MUF04_01995 [Akkermansiaceae bacterium]|jgi:hypothetical protein|nr:hypothetical protein [Akkermansiaceae bacterium]
MAWRIDEQVIRGEIDSRTRDRVTGRIWFVGRDEPVVLDLAGNPYRDLAGHLLRFSNPAPKPGDLSGLSPLQSGVTGDITASRKVRVPECSMDELMEHYRKREPFPWHWGNSLYLEWFSRHNGRVVIESSSFVLELEAAGTWEMSEDEERQQQAANAQALVGFMDLLTGAVAQAHEAERTAEMDRLPAWDDEEEDDDGPVSETEREADAYDEWMNTLLRRVDDRLRREGRDEIDFDAVYQEERARLNRERGIVEPEPTEEQLEERDRWVEEMNEICRQALEEQQAEAWKGEEEEEEDHPLQQRCFELGVALHHQLDNNGWVNEDDSGEHPLREVAFGVQIASAKLAGALGRGDREWPPDPLFAGDTLVRLKKARGHLRDALSGLDAADQGNLATAAWRNHTRAEISAILEGVRALIREVRETLADDSED